MSPSNIKQILEDRIQDISSLPSYFIEFLKLRFKDENNKIYFTKDAGLGSLWYIRRDNLDSPFEVFFMDSSRWGQYNNSLDDTEMLNEFKEDYNLVNL